MAETSMTPAAAPKKKSSLSVLDARTRKRNAAETRFRMYGMSAIDAIAEDLGAIVSQVTA